MLVLSGEWMLWTLFGPPHIERNGTADLEVSSGFLDI